MNIRTTCTTEEIRNADQMLPGAVFLGMFSDPSVNGGREIPMFTGIRRTLEEENAATMELNKRSFFATFGREPVNDEEIYNWIGWHPNEGGTRMNIPTEVIEGFDAFKCKTGREATEKEMCIAGASYRLGIDLANIGRRHAQAHIGPMQESEFAALTVALPANMRAVISPLMYECYIGGYLASKD